LASVDLKHVVYEDYCLLRSQEFDEEDSYKQHNHPWNFDKMCETMGKSYIFNSTFQIIRKIFQIIILCWKESSRYKEFGSMSWLIIYHKNLYDGVLRGDSTLKRNTWARKTTRRLKQKDIEGLNLRIFSGQPLK